jgi:peptide/nickel transport system permease protein
VRLTSAALLVLSASLKFVAGLLIIGFVATALVRIAPGFGTDERELDVRLANASIEQLKLSKDTASIPASYLTFLRNAAKGDFGVSLLLNRPVRELLEDRYSTTAALVALGWITGWTLAFVIAGAAVTLPNFGFRSTGLFFSGSVLCLPTALLAYSVAVSRTPAYCAVAAIVFAKVFRMLDSVFVAAEAAPFVTGARARGTSEFRIFLRHILSAHRGELIALSATSLTMAIGSAVPIEVLSDQAGIGQLAWKAAIGRDLPLLVSVTLLMAAVTLCLNRTADILVAAFSRRAG